MLINEVDPAVVRRRSRTWLLLVPLVLVAVGCSAWLGLNFDIRYVFGGLRAGPGTVFDTFVHRPLAYRFVVWALDFGPSVVTPGKRAGGVAEAVVRGEALLWVSAVCVWLRAGLRRYRPGRRMSVAGPLAGFLVLVCVATKLTTAPYALIAGAVVWLLDRRRA